MGTQGIYIIIYNKNLIPRAVLRNCGPGRSNFKSVQFFIHPVVTSTIKSTLHAIIRNCMRSEAKNAIQFNTIQYVAIRYDRIRYSMQYDTTLYVMQYNIHAMQYNTIQHDM
jgi:hypothetical protein